MNDQSRQVWFKSRQDIRTDVVLHVTEELSRGFGPILEGYVNRELGIEAVFVLRHEGGTHHYVAVIQSEHIEVLNPLNQDTAAKVNSYVLDRAAQQDRSLVFVSVPEFVDRIEQRRFSVQSLVTLFVLDPFNDWCGETVEFYRTRILREMVGSVLEFETKRLSQNAQDGR